MATFGPESQRQQVCALYFFRLSMIEAEDKRESEEKVNQSC